MKEEEPSWFENESKCIEFLELIRWEDTIICPYCESVRITKAMYPNRHHCNFCNTYFSSKTLTIFHDSKVPLVKWFKAIVTILNARKKPSVRRLARQIKVNKSTSARMIDKVSLHVYMQDRIIFRIAELKIR